MLVTVAVVDIYIKTPLPQPANHPRAPCPLLPVTPWLDGGAESGALIRTAYIPTSVVAKSCKQTRTEILSELLVKYAIRKSRMQCCLYEAVHEFIVSGTLRETNLPKQHAGGGSIYGRGNGKKQKKHGLAPQHN